MHLLPPSMDPANDAGTSSPGPGGLPRGDALSAHPGFGCRAGCHLGSDKWKVRGECVESCFAMTKRWEVDDDGWMEVGSLAELEEEM